MFLNKNLNKYFLNFKLCVNRFKIDEGCVYLKNIVIVSNKYIFIKFF